MTTTDRSLPHSVCSSLCTLGTTLASIRRAVGLDATKLGDVSSYKILSQSGCTTLDGVDDAEEFRGVKAAFDTIGMDGESQGQVWQLLASVLRMSNLEFDKVDHAQGEIASVADREVSPCQEDKPTRQYLSSPSATAWAVAEGFRRWPRFTRPLCDVSK